MSRSSLGENIQDFVLRAGVVPAEYLCRCDIPPTDVGPYWFTLFTSMWLHAGLLHISGNMLYLWIFGDNVEDTLGHLRYLLFYLASGVTAGVAQILADPTSQVPGLGASGAIAGVLAAYQVFFPQAQIRTLLFLGPFVTLQRIPALFLLGFWFVIQLVSGVGSLGANTTTTDPSGGVAYWAHIGGFVFGLVIALVVRSAGMQRVRLSSRLTVGSR